jgi:3-isopropylmalate dehydratase small subunit
VQECHKEYKDKIKIEETQDQILELVQELDQDQEHLEVDLDQEQVQELVE